MDIANITPTERVIEIVHPGTDEPLGVRVGVMSMDDDRMKRLRRQITDRSQKLAAKGKQFSAEELEQNANDILWTATTHWDWYGEDVSFHGEKPEYTQRNFKAVVDALPWFKRQISDELDDVKDFFPT